MISSDPADSMRLFTVEEVNELIPSLTAWFAEINRMRETIVSIVHSKDEIAGGNGHALQSVDEMRADLERVADSAERIRDLIETIQQTGAIVKDLERGVVDFRHQRAGHIICLCWHFGETQVGFWHDLDSGSDARKPL